MPASIKGTYEMAIANFGTPLYGATLACVPTPPRRPGATSRGTTRHHPTTRARPGKRHAPRRIHRLTPHTPSRVAAAHSCTLPRIMTRATPSPCVPGPRSASRPFTTTRFSFRLSRFALRRPIPPWNIPSRGRGPPGFLAPIHDRSLSSCAHGSLEPWRAPRFPGLGASIMVIDRGHCPFHEEGVLLPKRRRGRGDDCRRPLRVPRDDGRRQ